MKNPKTITLANASDYPPGQNPLETTTAPAACEGPVPVG